MKEGIWRWGGFFGTFHIDIRGWSFGDKTTQCLVRKLVALVGNPLGGNRIAKMSLKGR